MPKVRSGERLHEYRASYPYRKEYFKRNPGLFGCIWFCSQCYKPLIGKQNVIIDHIIPLSKGGRNHVSNCTAICKKCNLQKSDTIDARIIKGGIFKFFESNIFRTNRGAAAAVGLTAGLAAGAVNTTAKVGGNVVTRGLGLGFKGIKGVLGLMTFPIRKGSFLSRLLFLGIYVGAILYLLSEYTDVLDFIM